MTPEQFRHDIASLTARIAGLGGDAAGQRAPRPVVPQGCALVLYLLPQGAIEFTKAPA